MPGVINPQGSFRTAFARLELLLALAIVTLLLQIFPSAVAWLRSALDVRTWTVWSYFWLFAVFFVFLCGLRFGPEAAEGVRDELRRRALARASKRRAVEISSRPLSEREERELDRRMIQARKRQVV
jgi:cobalamin biosynthesis protein CobD/CbiB